MKLPATGFPPLDSREFLSFLRAKLTDALMINIWKNDGGEPLTRRTLHRWTADSRFASAEDSVRTNPIERFEQTLRLCMERGHVWEARGIVSRLAGIVGCELTCHDDVHPDRDDIRDECLDDQPAQTKFHEAIRELKSPDVVKFLMEELMEELRQTYQLYVSQYFRGKEARS